ncbi:matrixin family metalloprotease [Synoicihabitans lomoniglobus]|uniref:Matrixin family metalloprotease n=1 Tax=Synoicihabitans lomoniglobus TaxID=2909285 RepID=A0AAF0CSQ4_9BACT|nr:matrixin family metalloprotease [Opitutaceae bacterium LMO-M01]WED67404.1 matrixin family metalloprotease [Opitutaceae bacterium LMO-M01]
MNAPSPSRSSLHLIKPWLIGAAALVSAASTQAWTALGPTWPSGTVVFHLNLDDDGAPLINTVLSDNSANWNSVIEASLVNWNAVLNRIELVSAARVEAPAYNNGVTEFYWGNEVFGEEIDENVLGVTLYIRDPLNSAAMKETDIVFHADAATWNSYRGSHRNGSADFKRVALHEIGHALGLGHPDQANPVQTVEAVMNSTASNTDRLRADDIAGGEALYGQALVRPAFSRAPLSVTANVGDLVKFDFEVDGKLVSADTADPSLGHSWYFPRLDVESWLFTFHDPELFIGAAQTYDAGTYTVFIGNADGQVEAAAELVVNPVETSAATKMANLSTRAFAGSGSRTLTVGFVIEGTAPKRVLVRAVGPTLGEDPFNLPGTQADPRLTLIQSEVGDVATNDNWETNTTATAAEIAAITQSAGGFALPSGSLDAAILVELDPGVYTAQVEGAAGDEGLVIVEAYDVDATDSDSRLVNLSTRGYVSTGNNIIIAGLVVEGPAPRTYLLRAVGDTLLDFNILDYMDDTVMTLYQGQTIIRYVDDWDDPSEHQPMLESAMQQLGAFPLTDRQESALKITLAPGAYTLQVSGFGDAEGVALIEIYEFPED